ncbi:MAG: hypothetical protein H6739_15750 [Alphaproteobacteria bacterium]|nr:hypothetical protein [Alphaproteobacteria bacterium]
MSPFHTIPIWESAGLWLMLIGALMLVVGRLRGLFLVVDGICCQVMVPLLFFGLHEIAGAVGLLGALAGTGMLLAADLRALNLPTITLWALTCAQLFLVTAVGTLDLPSLGSRSETAWIWGTIGSIGFTAVVVARESLGGDPRATAYGGG